MLLNPGTFTDTTGTWTGGLANYNASNAQHVAFATKYDILPTANDPLYTFNVSTPVNNKDAIFTVSKLVASTSSARVDLAFSPTTRWSTETSATT